MNMQQTAPYPEILERLVSQTKYRDGWVFHLSNIERGQGSSGLTLEVLIRVADSYHPGTLKHIWHYMIVPAANYDERSWRRWLFEQILLIERHEAAEFFQIGDTRPYAPLHQPGSDPYMLVADTADAVELNTNFKGQVLGENP